ncbi:MAG: hypothetical protein U7127_05190 [Phormidium sp.]
MRIKAIGVNYERKFNLGNYNSVVIGCSLWANIDEDEDEDGCIQILQDKCREAVRWRSLRLRVSEYRKAKDTKPAETFRVNVGHQEIDSEFIPEGNQYRIDYEG